MKVIKTIIGLTLIASLMLAISPVVSATQTQIDQAQNDSIKGMFGWAQRAQANITALQSEKTDGGFTVINSSGVNFNVITTDGNQQPIFVKDSHDVDGNIKFGENGTSSSVSMHNGDQDKDTQATGITMHNGNSDGSPAVSPVVNTPAPAPEPSKSEEPQETIFCFSVVQEASQLEIDAMNRPFWTEDAAFFQYNGKPFWKIAVLFPTAKGIDQALGQKARHAWEVKDSRLRDENKRSPDDPNFVSL